MSSGESRRVLVVEDGWQVAHALKLSLQKAGMVVVGPAATVGEAQRLAAENRLDLAVVDINLQGEMAYDLVDRLHANDVPVIGVTGYEEIPNLPQSFAAVLRKPFTTAALLSTLQRVLR